MDTGRTLKRQLRYCYNGSETDEQRAQVQWWREKIEELRPGQPSADAPAAAPAVAVALAETGGGK